MTEKNLTMIMDLYELTMANGIFTSDMRDTVTYFDMFFRRVPDDGGYAIMAGVWEVFGFSFSPLSAAPERGGGDRGGGGSFKKRKEEREEKGRE